jgi:hypothetical protein
MPLAKLSVLAALRLARANVRIARHRRDGWGWKITARFADEGRNVFTVSRSGARDARRRLRIFVALAALGVDRMEAEKISWRTQHAGTGEPWETVVRSHRPDAAARSKPMEKRR